MGKTIKKEGTIEITLPDETEVEKETEPATLDEIKAQNAQLIDLMKRLVESLEKAKEKEKYPAPKEEEKSEETEKVKKPEKYPYKEEKAKKPEKYPYKEEKSDEAEIDWDAVDLDAFETEKGKLPKGLREWIEAHRKKKEESSEDETEKAGKPRRMGKPKTEEERRRTHQARYGTSELPPRGTGLSESQKPEKYPYKEEKSEVESFDNMIQRAIDQAIAKRLGEQPVKKRSVVPEQPKTFESPLDIPHEIFAKADVESILRMGGWKLPKRGGL